MEPSFRSPRGKEGKLLASNSRKPAAADSLAVCWQLVASRGLLASPRNRAHSFQPLQREVPGKRKGQLIIEFLIAAVLFFIVLLAVLTSVNTQAARFSATAADAALQAAAFRVSEQLLRSQGVWNFSAPVVSQLGLAKGPGVLEQRKLDTLQGICSTSYAAVLQLLDLGERPFVSQRVRILVTNSTSTVVDCGPAVTAEKPALAERLALQESGAAARLLVWVW